MAGIGLSNNIASLQAQRELGSSARTLSGVLERLSSGQRINSAGDDPAGLSLAAGLSLQSRIYTQALRNADDGVAQLNIADGALSNLEDILVRIKELAEQAANGVYSSTQRSALHQEADTLANEYNRIIQSTTFNGTMVFHTDGARTNLQLGFGSENSMSYSLGQGLSRDVGSGSFTMAGTVALSGVNGVVDFNGDGKADIYRVSGASTVVYLGNGDGTFTVSQTISPGITNMWSAYAGDLNGDGKQDLINWGVFGAGDQRYWMYRGNGDGTFALSSVVDIPDGLYWPQGLGDFNGDGDPDILDHDSDLGIDYIRFGSGGLSFAAAVTRNVSASLVGDFNNDGKDDLYSSAGVYLSAGNGTFALSQSFSSVGATNAADFNGDGNLDILGTSGSVLQVLLGNGNGTFGSVITTAVGSKRWLDTGDFNGDGTMDVLFTDTSNVTQVYFGNSDGTFSPSGVTLGTYNSGKTADLNGDGITDFLSNTASPTYIYLSNTSDSLTIADPNLSSQAAARATLADIEEVLQKVRAERGNIGASQSRLEAALAVINAQRDSFQAAHARVMDADVAQESAALVRHQIKQQVCTAILAQANLQLQQVLALVTNRG